MNTLKKILILYIIWKIFITIVGFIGLTSLPLNPNYHQNSQINFFHSWTNWDGGHYLNIAQNGYTLDIQLAFFPLYPLLIKLISTLTFGNFYLSAYLISNISLIIFLHFFYQYTKQYYSSDSANRGLLLYLFFPSSIFLTSAYSESLLLMFTMLSLYFANIRAKQLKPEWSLVWFFATLASLTKVTGFLISFPAIAKYLSIKQFKLNNLIKICLFSLLCLSGILFYLLYLKLQYRDPLIFNSAQTFWHRQIFVNPLITFDRYLVESIHYPFVNWNHSIDLIFSLSFLVLSIIVYLKLDRILGLYSFLTIFLPILTGTLDSVPRFALAAFPVFILLGIWSQNRNVKFALLSGFIFLQIIFTVLFINGYWLA